MADLANLPPAVVWCRYCAEPATGPDELCDPHRAGVPAAITDRWLAQAWARTVRHHPDCTCRTDAERAR